jgi:hypothetical protein
LLPFHHLPAAGKPRRPDNSMTTFTLLFLSFLVSTLYGVRRGRWTAR